jgi:mannose-6-phosphate isomerase-like protein (cupin superfamily)
VRQRGWCYFVDRQPERLVQKYPNLEKNDITLCRLELILTQRKPQDQGCPMNQIVAVDVTRFVLDLHRDLSVTPRATKPGPPERIDGATIGFVSVTRDAPHNGEVHPDGDEILYVISGRLRIIGESDPNAALDLGPGDACIVRKGEWHRVLMVEPAQLIHITPGPRGDYRPL